MATTFISNPNNKLEVNHKDGNKENNNVCNLEWNTHSENIKHSFLIGLRENTKKACTVNSFKATEKKKIKVIDINTKIIYNSIQDASNSLNIKYSTLCNKLNGNHKTNNTKLRYV